MKAAGLRLHTAAIALGVVAALVLATSVSSAAADIVVHWQFDGARVNAGETTALSYSISGSVGRNRVKLEEPFSSGARRTVEAETAGTSGRLSVTAPAVAGKYRFVFAIVTGSGQTVDGPPEPLCPRSPAASSPAGRQRTGVWQLNRKQRRSG
jgi:hypothetical protein